MLHERTDELLERFDEGVECACFSTVEEAVERIGYYLEHEREREAVAAAGRLRCEVSGYSIDHRAAAVLARVAELRGAAPGGMLS